MKKIKFTILVVITIFTFTLISCNDEDKIQKAYDYVTESIDFSNVTENIVIPELYEDVIIEFTSTDENVLNSKGEITLTEGEETVLCLLRFTFGSEAKDFMIQVKVKALELTDEQYLDKVMNLVTIETIVTENISLPTLKDNVSITWETTNPAITSLGVVTRGQNDIEVTLIATFVYKEIEKEKDYVVTVVKEGEEVFTISEYENWLKEQIPSETDIDLTLPVRHSTFGGTITWESSNEAIITDSGKITKSATDENVSLKYTISYNSNSKEGTINITVKAFNLENRYNDVVKSLNDIIKLEGTSITSDITLINESLYNSTIVWSSSNQNVISNTGKITRLEEDTIVTLTYVIYLDGKTYEEEGQEVTVTVKGTKASVLEPYYSAAESLTGLALKNKLHEIIDNNKALSYSSLWTHIAVSDKDPANSNNVILLYTGASTPASNHGGNQGNWNREHTWPQSRGRFGTEAGPGTDLHHLRPTWVSTNSARGNLDYDEGGVKVEGTYAAGSSFSYIVSGKSFEPRDEVKGDVARMLFYMATRYDGNGEIDLELNDRVNSGVGYMGRLSILLKWNLEDPVDSFEKNRNEQTYSIQGNRNPFIDHPEFVEMIWGTQSNFVLIKNDLTVALEKEYLNYDCILSDIKEKNC